MASNSIQVIQPGPSAGQAFGRGLVDTLQPILEREQQLNQTRRAIQGIRDKSQNASPIDQLYNLIEASTISPEIGRSLGPLYEQLMRGREAEVMANQPLTSSLSYGVNNQNKSNNIANPNQPTLQVEHSGSIGSEGRFAPSTFAGKYFPNNVGPNEAPGNLPQPETTGLNRPVLNPDQLIQAAQQRLRQWKEAGLNKTFDDAFNFESNINSANEKYNQKVENERQQRIESQEIYGQKGQEELDKLLPEATSEEQAIFRKKGEELAGLGKSEADIKRTLANEATKYKNTLNGIRKQLEAPRISNKLQRKFSGNERTLNQAQADARQIVLPLIKDGLYDRARSELAPVGFYPEERENILFPEAEKDLSKKFKDLPQAKKEKKIIQAGNPLAPSGGHVLTEEAYTPKDYETLKGYIKDVWGENPGNNNLNVLLMRKAVEDKGYDYRIYKDVLNELNQSGEIQFNDDQQKFVNENLNEPPLTLMEKLLYKLNLIGR